MKLYHGSGYKTDILRPGFYYTHQLEQWDETESNEWLYASTDKDEAILNGLASAVGKVSLLNKMHYDDKEVVLYVEDHLQKSKVDALKVYLYEIEADNEFEWWLSVNNKSNNSVTECKTKQSIKPRSCTEVKDKYCGRHLRIISQDMPKSLKW